MTLKHRERRDQSFGRLRISSGLIWRKKLEYLVNVLNHAGRMPADNVLEISLLYLTNVQKRAIIRPMLEKAKRLKIDSDRFAMGLREGRDTLDEVIKDINRNDFLKRGVYNGIYENLLTLQERADAKRTICPIQKRLDDIADVFGLSGCEKEVLLLLYLINTDTKVERLFDEASTLTDAKSNYRDPKSRKPIPLLSGLSRREVDGATGDKSQLIRAGLLDRNLEPAPEVTDFLAGYSSKPISRKYFAQYEGDAIPLHCHTIEKRHIDMVKALWEHKTPEQGVNVLLYGMPGTGKTEFARSLGKSLGLPVYEIHNIDDDKEKNDQTMFRFHALMACRKMVDLDNSVIIMDEADALLNSVPAFFSFGPVAEKGQINRLLDEMKGFVIWITNRYNGIDESTKRRFDYSIGFERLTFEQRKTIWKIGTKKYHLENRFPEKQLEELAGAYEVSAGGIDVALRNAGRIYRKTQNMEGIMPAIHSILKAHMKILDTKDAQRDTRAVHAPQYSLDGLNIRADVPQALNILEEFNAFWTHAGENTEIMNMNMLLYGPPGSGKTEFARYAARRLNRRMIVKRASDLLDKYVGETEKQIRATFQEAEKDKAVLFIDEADSFLGTREGAVRSWEITEVNEFLTCMENFRGILICATNFKRIMDSAAMRRFNIKLEFDFLRSEGNSKFYEVFFKPLLKEPASQEELEEITSMEYLTPGDFKVVYQQQRFRKPENITHRVLIEGLRAEVRSKNGNLGKKIGFGKA